MARLGPVHGCVARQVGKRERIMPSVQWVGCGTQAFLDGDSCWVLCRRPRVVRILTSWLRVIALLLSRQLFLLLHPWAKLIATCLARCEYICVSSIAVVHCLQFVVLHFVNFIVLLQCPHCNSCSVFCFFRFCHAYQPYMLVFVIQLPHRSVSV